MATFEIKMPKLGESVTEGTIVSWSVKVGDIVNEDDTLFEVNTAKVSAEIPSPVAGKVSEILFKEGDIVSVGTVVAIIELEGENGEPQTLSAEQAKAEEKPQSVAAAEVTPPPPAEQARTEEKPQYVAATKAAATPALEKLSKGDNERWYSPVVLEKAREAKIGKEELDAMSGTGYLGRVSKHDIEQYIESKKKRSVQQPKHTATEVPVSKSSISHGNEKISAPVSIPVGAEDEVIPMDMVRRIISERMPESKRISAHVTSVIEADVTKLVRWREQNKDTFKKQEGVTLTYMPVITEAVVNALKAYPRVNSSIDGYNIIQKKNLNIGIAVSLDDGNLIVPVIKNADRLSIAGLATSIASLAAKARSNKLALDDIQGGTFTITNFGSFNSLFGTPIINQPEIAILGVGVIEKKPTVIETPEGDAIAVRHKMYLSLSYDHRIIDGALGGKFLYYLAQYLENWNG